jgi:hypothetical protein
MFMKSKTKFREVPINQLRWRCNPDKLKIKTVDDIQAVKNIIGQDRALRALRLGLEIKHTGYNVFVTGFSGTGRTTTIKRLLSEFKDKKVPLYDYCYLHNIENADQPFLIQLNAGQGNSLKKDIDGLLSEFLKSIPAIIESKRYQDEKKKTAEHFQDRQRSVLKEFEKKVKERGFEVIQVQVGTVMRPDIVPIINNAPASYEQIETMIQQGQITKEHIDELMKERKVLEAQMEIVLREMRNIERKLNETIEDLAVKFVMPYVKEQLSDICHKYSCEKLSKFMADLMEHILSNLPRFNPPPARWRHTRAGSTARWNAARTFPRSCSSARWRAAATTRSTGCGRTCLPRCATTSSLRRGDRAASAAARAERHGAHGTRHLRARAHRERRSGRVVRAAGRSAARPLVIVACARGARSGRASERTDMAGAGRCFGASVRCGDARRTGRSARDRPRTVGRRDSPPGPGRGITRAGESRTGCGARRMTGAAVRDSTRRRLFRHRDSVESYELARRQHVLA